AVHDGVVDRQADHGRVRGGGEVGPVAGEGGDGAGLVDGCRGEIVELGDRGARPGVGGDGLERAGDDAARLAHGLECSAGLDLHHANNYTGISIGRYTGDMVRPPLTPEERLRGEHLGRLLRQARGERSLAEVAAAAGMSAETLRKIETGRIATPAFFTIAALADVLDISLDHPAERSSPAIPS